MTISKFIFFEYTASSQIFLENLDKSKLYNIPNIDFLNISKILKYISMISNIPLEVIKK